MHQSRRTLIFVGIFALVFVAMVVTVWLLSISEKMCIVRTGIEPDRAYEDAVKFKTVIREMNKETQDALVRAYDPSTGFFLYEAHPDGTVFTTNNDIRQLLASRALAEASVTDATLLALHKENIEAIMKEWYREEGGVGYVYAYEKSKLGGTAMLLRVLSVSPLFPVYQKEAKRLMYTIRLLQNEDGSFEPWFREPGYEYDKDYLLTFYSGEAILALLEYAEKTSDIVSFDVAKKAQDFYIGEYVDRIGLNYYPAYVPWHTLSLSKLYRKTGEERYKDAIFTMTDKLLELQDTTEFIGRFYNPETPQFGTPHASSDAVYTEGLAVAYALAKESGDAEREMHYRGALVRAFKNLKNLQFKASWYRVFDDAEMAEKLRGGIQTGACVSKIRIDSTAHTVDALSAMLRAL